MNSVNHTEETGPMNDTKPYALNLDGPLFRAQRKLLLKLADLAQQKSHTTLRRATWTCSMV